ncbi:DUF2231 domain-containing protein [Methylophilus sp. 'Pure River']|uniref:DUF2231 domain-containing protein n=1 Tax=Methylophilus sp. 'Pure River' TaxID=3377117 RepID=UPI00398E3165
MKFVARKRGLFASLHRYILCLVMTSTLGIGISFAEDNSAPYQSTFDDYQVLNKDSQTDWKSLDSSIANNGHSMSGMQHSHGQSMNHEAMGHTMSHGDAHTSNAANSDMSTMDHSKMSGMDHSQMSHMDHSKMEGMDHSTVHAEGSTHKHDHGMMNHAEMEHSADTTSEPMQMSHEEHQHDHPAAETVPTEESHSGHNHNHSELAKSQAAGESNEFKIIPNLHPAVVHFPIALTMAAFIFGLVARLTRKSESSHLVAAAGNYTLILAALSAIAGVVFGWLAFNSTMNHDDAGHAAMLLHRAWAIPTAVGLVLLAIWNSAKSRLSNIMSIPVLVCLAGLSMAVATTAWLGGEVVYRHGIGVLSLPASGGHNHQGHHGEASESDKPAEDNHTSHQHPPSQGGSHEH